MGFFAFGDLKKENTIKREKSLPLGVTSVSIENALTQEGMFYCTTYNCHMLERGCIANQKMASGTQPIGKTPLHRELCLNCSTGKDIAKKAKESIPKKVKTKRCARCKKWFPLEVFRRDDASISISYFSRCPACRAKYYAENKELREIEREVNL